jgi:hypothetical protein
LKPKNIEVDQDKKKELIVLVVLDIEENRQLVQDFPKEMKDRNDKHLVAAFFQSSRLILKSWRSRNWNRKLRSLGLKPCLGNL